MRRRPALAHFLVAWVVFSACPPFTSFDSFWTVPTSLSLVFRGDTNVDEYAAAAPAQALYALECVEPGKPAVVSAAELPPCPGGHYYNFYPLAVPVLAAPFVALMQQGTWLLAPLLEARLPSGLHPAIRSFLTGDLIGGRPLAELWTAAFLAALAAALQFKIAARFLPFRHASLLTLVFAFGTSTWSVGSRSLMQHGPSLLMLTAALYLAVRALENPRLLPVAALPLAAAVTLRPTNAISAAAFTLFAAVHHGRRLPEFLLWSLPVALPFFAYNLSVRNGVLPRYFLTRPQYSLPALAAGLPAHLFSPSRGLFVFTPVYLFSLAGIYFSFRRRWLFPLAPYLAAIPLLHALAVAPWLPGHTYGPRFFTEMAYLLVPFLIPALLEWQRMRGLLRTAAAVLFLAACLWGGWVHFRGATSVAANAWSATPVNVDQHPERVWDWRDPQFLRGL